MQQAWGDRGIHRPQSIVALAAGGELTADGDLVDAFTITASSARYIGDSYLKRRKRQANQAIAQHEPQDAIEALRRRFVAVLNEQLTDVERLQARGKHAQIKGEQLRQIARALRELAALPGPEGGKRARAPGAHDPAQGITPDGTTRGGLAGKIRATTQPRPITPVQDDAQEQASVDGETTERNASDDGEHAPAHKRINTEDSEEPGAYARERLAGLAASSVSIQRA